MRQRDALVRYVNIEVLAKICPLTDQGALLYPIGVFNILTDLALVVTPIFVLWSVQLPLSTRALVMGGFISRGL